MEKKLEKVLDFAFDDINYYFSGFENWKCNKKGICTSL
jgi:hypothetical protein